MKFALILSFVPFVVNSEISLNKFNYTFSILK